MHLAHLDEHSGAFWLRFSVPPGEDFAAALEAWKRFIPVHLRQWYGDDKLWRLPVTPETEWRLGQLFPDCAARLAVIRSQMELFR